jgi:hypothetical protein
MWAPVSNFGPLGTAMFLSTSRITATFPEYAAAGLGQALIGAIPFHFTIPCMALDQMIPIETLGDAR